MLDLITQNLKIVFDEKNKIFRKFFIAFFLVSFAIMNWNDVSWVFNHKFISKGLASFFDRNKIEVTDILVDFKGDEKKEPAIKKIEIPKIGVKAPIVFSEDNNRNEFQEALDKGILFYPQSDLPGKKGTTVLLGHSAPQNWPKVNYYWIFNNLDKLNKGDKIYIHSDSYRYIYVINRKFFLNVGEKVPYQDLTSSKEMLILLSCWPPETGQKRIAIEAELIN
ncbi:sortase [Patescibacteria group bacterium]